MLPDQPTLPPSMDPVAEGYVKLVLAVGRHDPRYVDAYYGPGLLKEAVDAEKPSLAVIRERAVELQEALPVPSALGPDKLLQLRRDYLRTQLDSLIAYVDILGGKKMTFDEESKALYDAVAPHFPDEHFEAIAGELDTLLPGKGSVADRYHAFRDRFVIPKDKLDTVFRAAIEECRDRTSRHIELPPGESFDIEYVTGKPWSAYNWYKGRFHSVIQVNTDLPIYIDRAIDLACHEGYPGHHVYNTLLESHLTSGLGWVEFSVYPLFSPQSLIAEGAANYGIEMAFPGAERLTFEAEKLFPLAGLDPETAPLYDEVQKKVEQLAYAGNEAARLYIHGSIDAGEAAARLMKYSLMEKDRAEQRVRFIDTYRSYVINYNLGKDLVRKYVEAKGGESMDRRWEVFGRLLSSPRLPSNLK
ncbi:MAG TPA: hypothetical protein VNI57_10045 [Candidatus Saccharimonadales bacterium]|nr:hypothetical protein [Candidatus Saccharimonadales bacterium]